MRAFLVPHTEGAGTGTLIVPCSGGTQQEQERSVKGISEMTTSMNACEHCNADVTLTPDPECEVVMVMTVAHDDDCKFYQQLKAKRWLELGHDLDKRQGALNRKVAEDRAAIIAATPRPRFPLAKAITARRNRDNPEWFVIEVECPYCPEVHTHGWAGPGDDGGHRAPHCADPWREQASRGYNIVIPMGLKVPR